MADNYFDQFDSPKKEEGNFFDQFDNHPPAEATGDAASAAKLQAGTGGSSQLERDIYSGLIKGTVGLPGMPGYLTELGGRGMDWAAEHLMSPERFEAYKKANEGRENPLPTPETFIKPFEEHVTGKLPEVATDPVTGEPLLSSELTQAVAGFVPGMLGGEGPAAVRALTNVVAPAVGAVTGERLTRGTGYEDAAALAGTLLGAKGAHNVERGITDRLAQERINRQVVPGMEQALKEPPPPPADNAAQITQEHINAAPGTEVEPVPPFGFGRDGANDNLSLISPNVPHSLQPTEVYDSVGAARAEGILEQTSPETKEYLGNWLREHYNEHTLGDRFDNNWSPHESLMEFNDDSKSMARGLISHPGQSRVETKDFLDTRNDESRERKDLALNDAFGPRTNPAEWRRELKTAQRNRSNGFWNTFNNTEIPPSPALDEVLKRPDIKMAIRQGTRAMLNRGEPVVNRFDNELGEEVTVPTPRVIQRAKKALDDRINNLITREGKRNQAVDLIRAKNAMIDAVDNHPDPNVRGVWKQGRETWAPEEELKDAYRLGENLLSSKVHWSDTPFLMEKLSAPEQRAVVMALRNKFADMAEGEVTDLREIKKILSDAVRKKIASVIGDEKADRLFKTYEAELRMRFNRSEISKGSQTAETQLYRQMWLPEHLRTEMQEIPSAVPSFSAADIPRALLHPKAYLAAKGIEAARKVVDKADAKQKAAEVAKWKKIREESARLLNLQGPQGEAVAFSLLRDNGATPPQPPPRRGGPVAPVAPNAPTPAARTRDDYIEQAMRNLRSTSRTAAGTLDLSSTPGKEEKMVSGLTPQAAARAAAENYESLIGDLHDNLDSIPTDGPGVAQFIDDVAGRVNEGIVKPGELERAADTKFTNQTKASDLQLAHEQFSDELAARLTDPDADPIETAAWIEWRANLMDHFWSDGVGKCLGRGTPVLMYDGTTKPVEQVVNGDLLMGPDSTPRTVSNVCSGVGPLFLVTPKKGESYVVNDNHVLSLRKSTNSRKPSHHKLVNVPVSEYISWGPWLKRTTMGWRSSVEWDEKDLPLSPYLLGVWLGDGTSTQAAVTTMDTEIKDCLLVYAETNGLRVKDGKQSGKATVLTVSRALEDGVNRWVINPLRKSLRDLNLINNKHIPHVYKTASRQQRLDLLAGLIDTDGSLMHNCFDIIQKKRVIADDIAFVARSVGLAAYVKSCQKTCTNSTSQLAKEYFRVTISGDIDSIPIRIARKKAIPRKQKKDVLITGIKVEPIGDGDYFGFTVDKDHLFLLGDFTVTHNSSKALAAIPLMRAGLPLPTYPPNKQLFSFTRGIPRVDPRDGGRAYLGPAWDRFNAYYHDMVHPRESLQTAIDRGAHPDEITSHPMVLNAVEANRSRVPTGSPEQFADPEWRANRDYDWKYVNLEKQLGRAPTPEELRNAPDDAVHGWDDAVERLTQQAEAYAGGPVLENRHAIIILGPPAAGKSSISEPLARRYRAAISDADDAKKVIPEYENGLGTSAVHEESSLLSKDVLTNLVIRGANIVLPKVGENYESIQKAVGSLKDMGYTVDIAHVAATPEISQRRNISRFLKTGRIVDPEYISSVGDKPRSVAYMLEGEANDFLDADTSTRPTRIIKGSGALANHIRAETAYGRGNGRDVVPALPRGGREGQGSFATAEGLIGDEPANLRPHRLSTADGTTVDVAPVVVEANNLRTSQDAGYDRTLQPRQRSRAASQAQIRDIASNLDPERLGYSAEADRGAPIVGPDGMVESGNGRVLALRDVYAQDGPKAQEYRDWLSRQGVDVSKYRNPVLVRQRLTPMSAPERQAFTAASNQAATLALSATERARADANLIDNKTLNLLANTNDLAANKDFVRRFVRELPQSEQGAIMDAAGNLSAEGAQRIRNAVFAKAYGDVGVLARIAESTNDEIRSISNALATTAPRWARLRADVESGAVRADMDVTADLMDAVKRTAKIRGEGQKLDTYLAQSDAFNKIPDATEGFMRMFYDPQGRRALGSKRVSDALSFYADESRKASGEPGLDLGLMPVDPRDIQRLAREKGLEGYGEEIPDRSGVGHGEGGEEARGQVRGPGANAGVEGPGKAGAGRNQAQAARNLQRNVATRTPSGRPMVTERLPIGNEEHILEAGLRRAGQPGGEQPPMMQAKKRTVSGQEDLFGGQNALGEGIRGPTQEVPGGRKPGNATEATPVRRPEQLSLFGGPGSEGDVVKPNAPVQQQPGGPEAPAPGAGERVTKPPNGSGRTGEGGTNQPTITGRDDAKVKIAQRTRTNYRITDEDLVGAGGPKQKVRGNIEAIKVLKRIEDENRDATPEEKAALVKYTGWGAHAQEMFDDRRTREAWEKERNELKAILTPEEYASARASTPNAHYTSPDVVRGMWDAMDHLGYNGGMAIEPSAGIGHFIGLIPDKWAPKTAWTAVELDSITGRIAKALYGNAEVNVHGFEDLKRPSNHYDLAISNVPFGDYDVREKPYGSHPIHNFFFIKSLDKVRPGGMVAFITSSHTMDAPTHEPTRRLLAKTSDLVGAIRLPGGKTGAFAGNAGTAVTTDIVFLRKKVPGEALFPTYDWAKLKEIESPEGPISVNQYFADNPNMMLGEMRLTRGKYADNEPNLIGPSEGLQEKIADAAKNMPAGAMLQRDTPPPPPIHSNDIGAGIKDGAFFVQDGKVYQRRAGEGHATDFSQDDHDKVKRFVGLRDTYNDLLRAQLDGVGDREALRKDLRDKYDDFVDKYGPINREVRTVTKRLNKAGEPVEIVRRPNFSPFEDDPDAWKVASIENYDPETGKAKPADIHTKDVIRPRMERQINGPSDALAASLNDKGYVDLDHIAQSLNLDTHEAAINALGDTIYQNPDGRAWETADKYLSGNVVKKLEDARAIAAEDPSYLRNVGALEKVQPESLFSGDITAQFGAPWVPVEVYNDFLNSIGGDRAKVTRIPVTGEYRVDAGYFSRDARTKFGTPEVGVDEIAEAALNGRRITVRHPPDADGKREVNTKATEEANVKAEAIKDAFMGELGTSDGWVWQDPERTQLLEGIYNRTYNNIANRKFDGSHLTLPGLNPDFTGRAHRNDAVWRMVENGNTLLAHAVGSGKTVTMIAGGMEQKRLGLISKPAYVVPNHMLEQFSREFIQAYPDAKVLVANKDEMSRENRKAFMAKVASNDWDGVVITHDAFGRINMRPEFRQQFIRDQLDELERVIKSEEKESGKKSQTVKGLEKAKKRLQTKLDTLLNEERKDEGTNFEESGIDFLFYDEAHKAKNLEFITRMPRVKGLAQNSSQRAEDLFLKTRYLEQNRPGRSAVFATGTPISNTMAEMWTMQRYLQFDKLKEAGLDTFDAWASTFGKVITNTELSADGRTFKDVSSFSKFVNIPELISLYSEIADTKTADMLKLPRPESKLRIIEADPSSQEDKFIQGLVQLAEDIKGKPPEPGMPNMASIATAGRKVAADGRLVGGTNTDRAVIAKNPELGEGFDFNPQGKIAKAIDNIHRIWKEGKEPGLVQMVFLDMGTPSAKGKARPVPEGENVDPARQETPRFDLYNDMKQRLVDKGIPANEIAFIHDAPTDETKGRLFERTRRGDVRVLFGSTEKMGVGTNVQKRLIAMHHLDAPWKPAEVEQRDGRMIRQGNMNPNVENFRYVTRRSFDAFMWQGLERKSKFLNEVVSGAKGSRFAEDVDNPLPEAAQMKAAASGDPRILEHAELDRDVRALTSQRRIFDTTKQRASWEANAANSRIEQYEKTLPGAREDAGRVTNLAGDKFNVQLGNDTITERKAAGQRILDGLQEYSGERFYTPKVVNVGKMSGFDMNIELRAAYDGDGITLRATPSLRGNSGYAAANDTVINEHTDPAGLIRRFENILGNIKANPDRLDGELKKERDSLKSLEKTLSGSWPKEKEYQAALKKLKDLTESLRAPKHPDVHENDVRQRHVQPRPAEVPEVKRARMYAPQPTEDVDRYMTAPQRAAGGRVEDKPPMITRKESHYAANRGTASHHCSICTMYRKPNKCTSVGGFIAAMGGCDWFKRKPAERADGGVVDPNIKERARSLANELKPSTDEDNRAAFTRRLMPETARVEDRQANPLKRVDNVRYPVTYGRPEETMPLEREAGLEDIEPKYMDHFQEPVQRASGGRVMPHYIDANPSEAQKKAGNYRKFHTSVHGMPITIENAKGSVRSGVGKDGKPWKSVLPYNYGYIKRTEGADGDHIDVMLGPHTKSRKVFVIDQHDADSGKFDETKTFIGYGSRKQVEQAYKAGFSDGKGAARLGHMTEMDIAHFRHWLADGDTTAPLKGTHHAPKIDLSHNVRVMSELSKDGSIFYGDKSLPRRIKNNGKWLDPIEPLMRHEVAEFTEMKRLVDKFKRENGRAPNEKERKAIYTTSHKNFGTTAERHYIESNGFSWPEWNAWCRGKLASLETEKAPNPPKNTDVRPIPHDRKDLAVAI